MQQKYIRVYIRIDIATDMDIEIDVDIEMDIHVFVDSDVPGPYGSRRSCVQKHRLGKMPAHREKTQASSCENDYLSCWGFAPARDFSLSLCVPYGLNPHWVASSYM